MATSSHIVYRALKWTGLLVGFVLGMLSLMVVVATVMDALWLHVLLALVLGIALPVVVTAMVMGRVSGEGRELVGDVYAITWLTIAVLVLGVFGGLLHDTVHREADRLGALGRPLRWFARPLPKTKTASKPPAVAKRSNKAPARRSPGSMRAAPPPRRAIGPGPGSMVASMAGPRSAAVMAARPGPARVVPPRRVASRPVLNAVQIFKRYKEAVVSVVADQGGGKGSFGTGFVIDANGTVATNQHVLGSSRRVAIKLWDGTWFHQVQVVKIHAGIDLAVLKIKTSRKLRVATLGDSGRVVVGERVVAIGNPLGLEHTITDGIVSQRRKHRGWPWIQISAPISKGNSGGPLINMYGEVIGINTAGIVGGQNLNLSVPINALKRLIAGKAPTTAPGRGTW